MLARQCGRAGAKPAEQKVCSRDRHGWSGYGRNRKKFHSVEAKPDITSEG